MEQLETMTFGQLKKIITELDQRGVRNDTKVFIDTGWDSLQEVNADALKVISAFPFQIEDVLTKEQYGGFVREEKQHTQETIGEKETVIVIEQFY